MSATVGMAWDAWQAALKAQSKPVWLVEWSGNTHDSGGEVGAALFISEGAAITCADLHKHQRPTITALYTHPQPAAPAPTQQAALEALDTLRDNHWFEDESKMHREVLQNFILSQASPAQAKDLVWRVIDEHYIEAETPFGAYYITALSEGFRCCGPGIDALFEQVDELNQAEEMCRSDFQKRFEECAR